MDGVALPEAPRRKVLRVSLYGSGAAGRHALRAILRRPDLQLAAQLVHTPEKIGRDAGEIAGLSAVGVKTTASFDDWLATPADCVLYAAADSGRPFEAVIAEMARILASGKNVVAITGSQMVHPQVLPAPLFDQLQAACEAGGAAFLTTGIGPGFSNDVLAVVCSSICDSVRSVTISERLLGRTYPYGAGVFRAMGFGMTPAEHEGSFDLEYFRRGFSGGIAMVAAALGVKLDEIRAAKDFAISPQAIVAAGGTVAPGQIGAIRFRLEGIVAGAPMIRFNRISSLTDTPIDDWEPQSLPGIDTRRMTQIRIDADPEVKLDMGLVGSGIPGEEATGHRAVNAIRAVCEAAPGVKGVLDLPLFGGAAA